MNRRSAMTLLTLLLIIGVLVGIWRFSNTSAPLDPPAVTRAHMGVLRVQLELHAKNGPLPASLDALPLPANSPLRLDGWNRPITYALAPDGHATLTSLGYDNAPGGAGESSDITLDIPAPATRPSTQP